MFRLQTEWSVKIDIMSFESLLRSPNFFRFGWRSEPARNQKSQMEIPKFWIITLHHLNPSRKHLMTWTSSYRPDLWQLQPSLTTTQSEQEVGDASDTQGFDFMSFSNWDEITGFISSLLSCERWQWADELMHWLSPSDFSSSFGLSSLHEPDSDVLFNKSCAKIFIRASIFCYHEIINYELFFNS